jgi:hypothetical protein
VTPRKFISNFEDPLVLLSLGSASAQTDVAKAIQERLATQVEKLLSSCADEITGCPAIKAALAQQSKRTFRTSLKRRRRLAAL